MTDSTRPDLEERMDRLVRGELTGMEARELAQASLDTPELFAELTDSALAKAALSARVVPARKVLQFPRTARFLAAAMAVAAGIVLVTFAMRRSTPPADIAASVSPKPTLAMSADLTQPVLLAAGLQPDRDVQPTEVFRGAVPDGRLPQPAGAIVSIEDGLATINLGSLDGVAKEAELSVFRDAQSSQPVGRFVPVTVFRERARGWLVGGQQARVGDQVRVPGAAHLGSLLERVDALSSRGDSESARSMAEQAAAWAESANVAAGERGKVVRRLAVLEYQAGALESAETHYRSLVNLAPEPAAWNDLAVLHILRGDYSSAAETLNRAVLLSSKADTTYGLSLNNLGVLAELRGDRRQAELHFADAMRVITGAADSRARDRRAVEANLTRIRGLR